MLRGKSLKFGLLTVTENITCYHKHHYANDIHKLSIDEIISNKTNKKTEWRREI